LAIAAVGALALGLAFTVGMLVMDGVNVLLALSFLVARAGACARRGRQPALTGGRPAIVGDASIPVLSKHDTRPLSPGRLSA